MKIFFVYYLKNVKRELKSEQRKRGDFLTFFGRHGHLKKL